MGRGWSESEDDYQQRISREANERIVEETSGKTAKQGWFEGDNAYASRISDEANEGTISSFTGDNPKQGWFESDGAYRERIDLEANEATIERYNEAPSKQGWFESDEDYDHRVRHEANEAVVARYSNAEPKQGFFESNARYRQRMSLAARELYADRSSYSSNFGSIGGGSAIFGVGLGGCLFILGGLALYGYGFLHSLGLAPDSTFTRILRTDSQGANSQNVSPSQYIHPPEGDVASIEAGRYSVTVQSGEVPEWIRIPPGGYSMSYTSPGRANISMQCSSSVEGPPPQEMLPGYLCSSGQPVNWARFFPAPGDPGPITVYYHFVLRSPPPPFPADSQNASADSQGDEGAVFRNITAVNDPGVNTSWHTAVVRPGNVPKWIKVPLGGFVTELAPLPDGKVVGTQCSSSTAEPPTDAKGIQYNCFPDTVAYWVRYYAWRAEDKPITIHWRFKHVD